MCEPWRAVAQWRGGRPLPLRDRGHAGEAPQRTREATRCRAPRGPRRLRILRASLGTLSSKWRRKALESLPLPDGQWPEGACIGTLAEVKAQAENLAAYKRPRRIQVRWEEFNKTSTGKIKRYLYQMAASEV